MSSNLLYPFLGQFYIKEDSEETFFDKKLIIDSINNAKNLSKKENMPVFYDSFLTLCKMRNVSEYSEILAEILEEMFNDITQFGGGGDKAENQIAFAMVQHLGMFNNLTKGVKQEVKSQNIRKRTF